MAKTITHQRQAREDIECAELATRIFAALDAFVQPDHEVEDNPNIVWVESQVPGEWLRIEVQRRNRKTGAGRPSLRL